MYLSTIKTLFLIVFCDCTRGLINVPYDLADHTSVTKDDIFPYVAAILKKSKYLCAGALIDESWVLTAADALFAMRDSLRILRVRLGSINNRKGGRVYPVKFFEIHPMFDDQTPEYDLALIRLPKPMRLTVNLNPIRIQRSLRLPTATHYIVTGWPLIDSPKIEPKKKDTKRLTFKSVSTVSVELEKRQRILQVGHLHPSSPQRCTQQLEDMVVKAENFMCLESALASDPCQRDTGAPVVLNNVLWGIVSSWKPEDCDLEPAPSLVTRVATVNVSSWIHSTIHGKKWTSNIALRDTQNYDYEYPQSDEDK